MNLFNKEPDSFLLPDADLYSFEEIAVDSYTISTPYGEILFFPRFVNLAISDRTVAYLIENDKNLRIDDKEWRNLEKENLSNVAFINTAWSHDKINMYGRETYIPRFSAWYGDPGMSYTYSGLRLEPHEWNRGLKYIKNKLEVETGYNFNSALLNWYRDGQDYIGWHTDNEKSLGKRPYIASLNFGATRLFKLKPKNGVPNEQISFKLSHGSLLLMKEGIQEGFVHMVPKEGSVKKGRINLTFRKIV